MSAYVEIIFDNSDNRIPVRILLVLCELLHYQFTTVYMTVADREGGGLSSEGDRSQEGLLLPRQETCHVSVIDTFHVPVWNDVCVCCVFAVRVMS